MRRLAALSRSVAAAAAAAAVAAATAMLGWPGWLPAQQAQTTLPEMNVTAPKNPPVPEWYAPRPGIWGKVRVEEDKWPEIPCTESHVNVAGAAVAAATPGKCQEGWKGTITGNHGSQRCTIHHPLITVDIGRFAVEADVLVFDPYLVSADFKTRKGCTVWTGYTNLPNDFRDMNQVARRGVGWRNFIVGSGQPGAQSTMQFSDGARNCEALERLGPFWQGGFRWVLHATLCAAAPAPITPPDIDTVVAALKIHAYDPDGNLAPPPPRE
jgi:hypothetical protein